MNCPYPNCGRIVTAHPSGLGFDCPMCGFIPTLVMQKGVPARWTPKRDEEKDDLSTVPAWDKLTLGTESKGRIEVMMPVDATELEAKRRIDSRLSWMYYLKTSAKDMGMDIEPTMKKSKKEDE